MTPRKRTLRGHLFSNSQEEDVIEEMTRRWMTNWNDYGVRDIVHTMKQWDSLVQLHAATLMCNIIIQEYEDDGSSAAPGLVDLRKRASTGLPFGFFELLPLRALLEPCNGGAATWIVEHRELQRPSPALKSEHEEVRFNMSRHRRTLQQTPSSKAQTDREQGGVSQPVSRDDETWSEAMEEDGGGEHEDEPRVSIAATSGPSQRQAVAQEGETQVQREGWGPYVRGATNGSTTNFGTQFGVVNSTKQDAAELVSDPYPAQHKQGNPWFGVGFLDKASNLAPIHS
ncbi:hypothetical protein NDU88_001156 [Pleurodeles waltl]|uniref:Uncharacterized protein n=1 Tax=Pleurodeles waltl TaxID=8319 RepID=A0AAV7MLV3_PLEWA|nr:hypothetical protein NDU88_001156 [Pleurodeles waltl]